jgi:hypothetical protein
MSIATCPSILPFFHREATAAQGWLVSGCAAELSDTAARAASLKTTKDKKGKLLNRKGDRNAQNA